jgi:hypothetical protein
MDLDFSSLALQMDAYNIRARLWPALITALPFGLVVYALLPGKLLDVASLGGIVAWCGGAYVLAQFAREAGYKKQASLFESWDGAPTTRMLRHHQNMGPMLRRRHEQIEAITGESLPSAQEEQSSPEDADQRYRTCVMALRERTRDTKAYPLVFAENCAYGFRRNLLGLRPIGIGTSLLSTVTTAIIAQPAVWPLIRPDLASLAFAGIVSTLMLSFFAFVVTPEWVRAKAEAYAERLLAACEKLHAA